MFKYVAVVCVFAALCAGAPRYPEDVQSETFEHVDDDGSVRPHEYNFAHETSDGTSIDNPESDHEFVNDQHSFEGPDGQHYTISFIVGPHGFEPKITHGHRNSRRQ